MNNILLEALPGFTWWGGFAVTAIMGIISWLFNAALKAEREKGTRMQAEIDELEAGLVDLNKKFDLMKDSMHHLQLEILGKINEVGIKIEGFRRDLSK